ncbi:ferric enterobactin transporter permease FepG [Corynebacterium sp. 13CS0277]|uniref:FecCD family ABC transporter permease n=1 Tax=Corynebacterium sp. 13CS0277 TaxID=2071994 RepID=UPI000D039A58|nr:iron chelate uptake ABC transporter family permease subunit [Corynebacterium sp. 13CS0277]PRQ11225.1 ferric enterobactin transporter permease FepG [Corynebacterium sp. 13CS0277]
MTTPHTTPTPDRATTQANYTPRTLRAGRMTIIVHPRTIVVSVLLAAGLVAAAIWAITVGDYPLTPHQVVAAFTGGGDDISRTIVLQWRAGRVAAGLAVGAALGMAGALTQSVARNPLASPDVLGISSGASVAVVAALTLTGRSAVADAALSNLGVPLIAIVGGLATGIVMWLLAGRTSRDNMLRLVLTGVAVSMFLSAATTWLLARAQLDQAAGAKLWLTGSLVARDWGEAIPALVVVAVCIGFAGWLAFALQALTLGPDVAHMLGHNVRRAQGAQLVVAVVLTAVAVAAAGPIAFVAFVCPQIALRLCGSTTPPLVPSALVGALLLVAADVAARTALPWEVPVGIVTAAVGAPVLLALVIRLNRKTT